MAGRSGLSLADTLSGRTKRFTPRRHKGAVRVFTCGPSVYRRQHLGNYRTFLYEDILVRYLEYLGYEVERLMNFTDVEDKAITEAERRGIGLDVLTKPVIEQFRRDARLLRIGLPDQIPRSSTSVDSAVRIIERLVTHGNAYWHRGSVYFDPLTYPGFGQIYGLDMTRWPKTKRRFSRDTYPGERWNLGDFILWHGARRCTPACWDTRIGKGRPAWNIQDPAIILEHLGSTVDISCGGVDNLFRHHDYIRAIMESYSHATYARFWLHGELLMVNGRKMSKRYGNVVYPERLLEQGYSPRQIRFFLVYGHYRRRLDLTAECLERACSHQEEIRRTIRSLRRRAQRHDSAQGEEPGLLQVFYRCMNDDLDVQRAIDGLEKRLRTIASSPSSHYSWHRVRAELDTIESVLAVGF